MYSCEREYGRLVDTIQSHKVCEESIVRHYVLLEFIEHTKVAESVTYESAEHRSDVHARSPFDLTLAPLYLQHEQTCTLLGKSQESGVPDEACADVLALWRSVDPEIDSVFMRFEAEVKAGTTTASISNWLPSAGPALSAKEKAIRRTPAKVAHTYVRAMRNACYFRGVSADSNRARAHKWCKVRHPRLGECYGMLSGFFSHQAYLHADSPCAVFARVSTCWLEPIIDDPITGLKRCRSRRVRPQPDHADYKWFTHRIVLVQDVLPVPITCVMQSETAEERTFFIFEFGRGCD
jgi:hypothetical protein